MISSDTKPCLAAKTRLQTDRLTGKPALLFPEGVLFLNPTGFAIAELCDNRHTVAEIQTMLAARYRVQSETVAPEVMQFLQRLQERGLLTLQLESEEAQ